MVVVEIRLLNLKMEWFGIIGLVLYLERYFNENYGQFVYRKFGFLYNICFFVCF